MRRIISFMHKSLEGFITGPNGEMNRIRVAEEIFDQVSRRASEGDTALHVRITYRMVEKFSQFWLLPKDLQHY